MEPSVLGGIHACADWLVSVVRDGVEGAYKRANPALFIGNGNKKLLSRSESSSANCDRKDFVDARQRMENRRQQSFSRRNTVADVENEGAPASLDGDGWAASAQSPNPNIVHEVQFDPAAASSSKKWFDSKPEPFDEGKPSSQFDPEAAGSRATKKAKPPSEQSPARALGDLGREEHGLFLILHADDIHTGAQQPTEVIEALKELFSSPGGAGRQDTAVSPPSALSSTVDSFSLRAPYMNTHGPFAATARGPTGRLAPRLGRDSNRFLFRTPHVDSLINKMVKMIKKHGNLVVWGTQEIVAEVGEVRSRCWLHADPDSSAMVGAAMLNRAKILTDRGLVSTFITNMKI